MGSQLVYSRIGTAAAATDCSVALIMFRILYHGEVEPPTIYLVCPRLCSRNSTISIALISAGREESNDELEEPVLGEGTND